jgi:hypothetical protein
MIRIREAAEAIRKVVVTGRSIRATVMKAAGTARKSRATATIHLTVGSRIWMMTDSAESLAKAAKRHMNQGMHMESALRKPGKLAANVACFNLNCIDKQDSLRLPCSISEFIPVLFKSLNNA